MMTASTLYEAVEPQLIWKHFLSVVFDEILGDGTQFEVRSFCYFHFSFTIGMLGSIGNSISWISHDLFSTRRGGPSNIFSNHVRCHYRPYRCMSTRFVPGAL